ncbi:TetR/AcrR family transcriptional regulator [Rhodococcus sp. HNM0569]|uniref:TetR/AcrR family transcriptional regulator n=1 Tax=Rhodococcus sp. HNM0569 TaxID=2716340 RepID=UPI00146C809A|nr:TetR/AcrR family transcriptional regulator [Rhodococcus sp. HNM0569]NLU83496.1 TetR family transcriptional regulator [Rhodococcus sp. HNM0569]
MTARRYSSTSPEQLATAVFDVAAEQGLDNASVREVAKRAGVSIGAVQHHFATKDAMLDYTLRGLLDRLLHHVADLPDDTDARTGLTALLGELLPLDERRTREAHVRTAFAVRAVTSVSLAEIRRGAMFALRSRVSAYLLELGADEVEISAALLLGAVEGLALDALSGTPPHSHDYLRHALDHQIELAVRGPRGGARTIELAS